MTDMKSNSLPAPANHNLDNVIYEQRANRLRRAWLVLLVLCGLAAGFLGTSSAHAQRGGDEVLPDPISGRVLTGYAHRLGLSDQQRLAVDSFHAEYLDAYRELREREIDPFTQEATASMRAMMFNPDASAIKDGLRRMGRITNSIRSLDERLFDQMQSLLTAEQAGDLPRVRQARERERLASGFVRLVRQSNQGAQVDLSAIVAEIDVPEEEMEVLDPLVQSYESRLTSAVRKLQNSAEAMMLEVVKGLEDLAPMQEGRPNRDELRQRFGLMRDVWSEAGAATIEQASAISRMNRDAHRSFSSVINRDASREFTTRYYREAYPSLGRRMEQVNWRYKRALDLPGLSDDTVAAVEAGFDELTVRHETLAAKMIDLIEEQRKEGSMFRFGRDQSDLEDRIDELEDQLDKINEQATERLTALLGPEHSEELARSRRDERERRRDRSMVEIDLQGPGGGSFTVRMRTSTTGGIDLSPVPGPDPYLPGPITAEQVDHYAAILDADENQRMILESLHADYRDSYDALKAEKIDPMLAQREQMWRGGRGGGRDRGRDGGDARGGAGGDNRGGAVATPAPGMVDQIFDTRLILFDDIRQLDDTFFADMKVVAVAPNDNAALARVDRLRLARERSAYNRAGGDDRGGGRGNAVRLGGNQFGSDEESTLDLARLVDLIAFAPEAMDAIEPLLLEYERDATAAFQRRFHARMKLSRATERMSLEAMAARQQQNGNGNNNRFDFGSNFREVMESTGAEQRAADALIFNLNRSTLSRMEGALPESEAATLRDGYYRAAWPSIYRDPGSAESFFQAALALENLSDSQREEIRQQFAEFRGPYLQICREMAEVRFTASANQTQRNQSANGPGGRGPGGGPGGGRDWQRSMEMRNQTEQFRFDRNELNDKAMRRLKATLTAEQLALLGIAPAG